MNQFCTLILIVLLFFDCDGQSLNQKWTCSSDDCMNAHPECLKKQEVIDSKYYEYFSNNCNNTFFSSKTTTILPIVVHVIHQNGPENISDKQINDGIKHLNEAFSRVFGTGVNTDIQFCLAQRTPFNQPTSGITRDVSPLTILDFDRDDINMKNVNRWDPFCYINIWLVADITNSAIGYAYLPGAHGAPYDGIVIEASYFGSSRANSGVIVHEIGHYLGLLHTFNNGCANGDCLADGDQVCDTPPDQTTFSSCVPNANSCNTDTDDKSSNNPLTTDVPDHGENYMDYSTLSCFTELTEGQSKRMNYIIQNVRRSLLNCLSCSSPCNSIVTADITSPSTNISIPVGSTYNFQSLINNSSDIVWSIDGITFSTLINPSYTFNQIGKFKIKLKANSPNTSLCLSVADSVYVNVICNIKAAVTASSNNVLVNNVFKLTNKSTGSNNFEWYVNDIYYSNAIDFLKTFNVLGRQKIQLVSKNNFCIDTLTYYLDVVTDCSNRSFQLDIGEEFYEELNSCIQTNDGNFFSVGYIRNPNNNTQGHILKIDIQSNIIFSQTLINSNFHEIIRCKNGGYLIAGTENFSWVPCTGNPNQAGLILKIDEQGIPLWTTRVSLNTLNGESIFSIYETANDEIAITGISNRACSVSSILCGLLDKNGQVIWAKTYDDASSDGGYKIIESNDGHLICTGASRQSQWTDVFALKINRANGNILWSKTYDIDDNTNNYGNNDGPSAIDLLPNGNPMIVGSTNSLISWSQNGTEKSLFILEINSMTGVVIENRNYTYANTKKMSSSGFKINKNNGQLVFCGIDATSIPNVSKGSGASGIFSTDMVGNVIKSTYLTSGFINDLKIVNQDEYLLCGYNGIWTQVNNDAHIVKVNKDLETTGCPLDHPRIERLTNFSLTEGTGNWRITNCEYAFSNILTQFYNKDIEVKNTYCIETCPDPICPNLPIKFDSTILQCGADSVQLLGPSGYDLYNWAPPIGINNPNIQNPKAYITQNTNYELTAYKLGDNLSINNGFAKSNFGFSSDYTFNATSIQPGEYSITNNPQILSPSYLNCNDHSSNNDLMLIIKTDATSKNKLYCQTIKVIPNMEYKITVWALNLIINNNPTIQFVCNGKLQPEQITLSNSTCNWQNLTTSFFTKDTALLNICLILQNTPNVFDLALDDFSCRAFCEYKAIQTINLKSNSKKNLDLGPDIILCNNSIKVLDAGPGFQSYLWENGETGQTHTIFQPGKYKIIATDSCGKIYFDSLNIILSQPPMLNLPDTIKACENNNVKIEAINKSLYSNFNWTSSETINCALCSTAEIIAKNNARIYLVASTKDGCSVIDSAELIVAKNSNSSLNYNICGKDTIMIGNQKYTQTGNYTQVIKNYAGCDSILQITIQLGQASIFNQSIVICEKDNYKINNKIYTKSGIYIDTLVNSKACDSIITTTLTVISTPKRQQKITLCRDSVYNFNGKIYDQELTYTDTIANPNGCDSVISTVITKEANWNLNNITIQNPKCNGDKNGIIKVINLIPNLDIYYELANNPPTKNQLIIDQLSAGKYTINAISSNGCPQNIDINLFEPSRLDFIIDQEFEYCTEDSLVDLGINLTDTANGRPYRFFANGKEILPLTLLKNLSEGVVEIRIQDKNDCFESKQTIIPKIIPLSLQSGQIIEINYQNKVQLISNVSGKQPLKYLWSPSDDLSCTDCPNPIITGNTNREYTLTVFDEYGCTATSVYIIKVKYEKDIYVPNVFSPNKDGINETIIVEGKNIDKILLLEIFDRWGELIYRGTNMDKNSKNLWDGTFRGKPLNPAVFVYVLKVNFIDGSTRTISSDIQLLR